MEMAQMEATEASAAGRDNGVGIFEIMEMAQMEATEASAAGRETGSEPQHAIDVIPAGDQHANGDANVEAVNQERLTVVEEPLRRRVAALDAFRGITVMLMMLVGDAGRAYQRMDHSPWNGCSLADFVTPFFLFIVGVAIAFAMQRVPNMGAAVKKVSVRTLKMLFWGLLLQGGYSHAPDDLAYGVDMKTIRWCGILQRIALVYFVVALIEVFTIKVRPTTVQSGPLAIFNAYRWQWLCGFIVFLVYMVMTFSLYVPDWSFVYHPDGSIDDGKRFMVRCGVRGNLDPACNAVGYVDRQVWGINHLYRQPVWIRTKECTFSSPETGHLRPDAPAWCRAPFEPEGLLSSISSILSGTIGIHYGHVLIHFRTHRQRLTHWLVMGFSLLALGILLHFTRVLAINRQLYSFSYVCFTGGGAGILLSAFYILIEVWGRLRIPLLILEWIGRNAMLVFVLAAQGILAAFLNGWYYESPDKTIVNWIQEHVFVNVWHSEKLGTLLYVIFGEILFWAFVSCILHKLGIYWKL